MAPQTQLNPDVLNWLHEENEPGVRCLAPRDVVGLPPDDPTLLPTT